MLNAKEKVTLAQIFLELYEHTIGLDELTDEEREIISSTVISCMRTIDKYGDKQ